MEASLRVRAWLGLAAVGVSLAIGFACVGETSTPPGKNDVTCTGYCTDIMQKCVADDQGTNNLVYKDMATCLDVCANLTLGAIGDNGNTVACRLGNLSNLDDVDANPPAARHQICLEGAAYGCGDICENFCTLDQKICPGTLFPYASHADCVTQCKGYDQTFTGPFVGASGNNLQCRAYHLENAVVSAVAQGTHCPHTGPGQPGFGTALCNTGTTDAGTDSGTDAGVDASQDAKTD
jgi:hypothetical protein